MWQLNHKKGWVLKNWCFWTVVLEKTLESPLDSKEIQPVHPKGNQSWIFIGRTDAEAEVPILWPPDGKSQVIEKAPDAGKDWRQEKGTTEDEMVGWHHRLNGHEFAQTPGDGEGQGSLLCCSPWGCTESDTTEQLNNESHFTMAHCWRTLTRQPIPGAFPSPGMWPFSCPCFRSSSALCVPCWVPWLAAKLSPEGSAPVLSLSRQLSLGHCNQGKDILKMRRDSFPLESELKEDTLTSRTQVSGTIPV